MNPRRKIISLYIRPSFREICGGGMIMKLVHMSYRPSPSVHNAIFLPTHIISSQSIPLQIFHIIDFPPINKLHGQHSRCSELPMHSRGFYKTVCMCVWGGGGVHEATVTIIMYIIQEIKCIDHSMQRTLQIQTFTFMYTQVMYYRLEVDG